MYFFLHLSTLTTVLSSCVYISIWICAFCLWSSYPAPLLVIRFFFLLVILILCFHLLGLEGAVYSVYFVYPCRLCSIRYVHCREGASLFILSGSGFEKFNFPCTRLFFSRPTSSLLHSYMQIKHIFYLLGP